MINKRCKKIGIVILSLLLLIYLLRFTTIFDEDYTLILINHNWVNVIKYSSLDVHPPLYYLLLKLFLFMTTFWTKSLLIKILFSRIFSVIISLISFLVMLKILKFCHIIDINKKHLQLFLIFLFIPGVISFTYEFIKIRMYSLGALFIIIDFYELLQYNYLHKKKNIIIVTILNILIEYTNYYAALITGLLLLIYFVIYILRRDHKYVLILYSVLIMIISFIPWIPELCKQFNLQRYHPLPPNIFSQWSVTLVLFVIFIYSLRWSNRNLNRRFNFTYLISFYTLLLLLILMGIISILYRPVFQFRYIYPIFLIYSFLSITVILQMFLYNKCLSYSILLISLLSILFIGSYIDQIYNFNVQSIPLIEKYDNWNHTCNKDVITISDKSNNRLGDAMYLLSIKRKCKAKGLKEPFISNPSYKDAFKNVDDNIEE